MQGSGQELGQRLGPQTGRAHLSASDLACRRGDRLLFRGLDLALEAGAVCHVTGANGVGKTSLLRVLAGLLSPFDGRVEASGDVGLLDERPALDPDRTLGDALAFWQHLDGCSDPDATLARMGLTALLDIPVRYLSTGQKKRAAFASLINRNVPIWLLDEPLNGLDSAARDTVTELVESHRAAGGICVIASHLELAISNRQSVSLEDYAP